MQTILTIFITSALISIVWTAYKAKNATIPEPVKPKRRSPQVHVHRELGLCVRTHDLAQYLRLSVNATEVLRLQTTFGFKEDVKRVILMPPEFIRYDEAMAMIDRFEN